MQEASTPSITTNLRIPFLKITTDLTILTCAIISSTSDMMKKPHPTVTCMCRPKVFLTITKTPKRVEVLKVMLLMVVQPTVASIWRICMTPVWYPVLFISNYSHFLHRHIYIWKNLKRAQTKNPQVVIFLCIAWFNNSRRGLKLSAAISLTIMFCIHNETGNYGGLGSESFTETYAVDTRWVIVSVLQVGHVNLKTLVAKFFSFNLSGNSNQTKPCYSTLTFELEFNAIWNFNLDISSIYFFELWLPSILLNTGQKQKWIEFWFLFFKLIGIHDWSTKWIKIESSIQQSWINFAERCTMHP